MHLMGLGFGGLGVDDTNTLQPGNIVTFKISGILCPIGFSPSDQDIADAVNNWASWALTVNAVQQTAFGYIPGQFEYQVNATVKQPVLAGSLRGLLIGAIDAFGKASSCNDVKLVNNQLTVAGGGTGPVVPNSSPPPPPDDTCGFFDALLGNCSSGPGSGPGITTTIIIAVVGLVAVAFLTRK